MKKQKLLRLLTFLLPFFLINGQIGINTAKPYHKAMLEIFSNDKGFLPPRLTTAERDILLPADSLNLDAEGMTIYNKTVHCLEFWNSMEWINMCQGRSAVYIINCEPVVSGSFYAGAPASGSVRIKVTVSRPGSYKISTAVINGMSFNGEGNFETTGEQYVILSAEGTPVQTGNYTYSIVTPSGYENCAFAVRVTGQPSGKVVRILSIVPDAWNGTLSTDSYGRYSSVARSKLTNPSNFGPNGSVVMANFIFNTINIRTASPAELSQAIDNSDIVWIGYVYTSYFSDQSIAVLRQKIQEKRKFFVIDAEHQNLTPINKLNIGYTAQYINSQSPGSFFTTSSQGPNSGAFGTLPENTRIQTNRYMGRITQFPATAKVFMKDSAGRVAGTLDDNVLVYTDVNLFYNYESADKFYNEGTGCTESSNARMFCNMFDIAVNYVR
ncbi:hypothetical protein EG352_16790 [Chryseobacterium indologenes]|uniref:Uncharacterized protein n=1 Tax=Chryseobacterium indologenes TaxID=253 RepID=A0AAD1DXF8_CHRID|nr:hypothetical protein [Chryseobacterium indologenes]AZB19317.1 hypothetical protein EG352_16790 [Chryseobacterium indologenes]